MDTDPADILTRARVTIAELQRLVDALAPIAGAGGAENVDTPANFPRVLSDLAPCRWFTTCTLVSADQLSKADDAEVGRVRRDGRQNLYSKSKVRTRWPERWQHPQTDVPPE